MQAADLIVTKPGGVSCAEALASTLPLILFPAFAAQEAHNARYLVSHRAAVRVDESRALPETIDTLVNYPSHLHALHEAARRLARPHAAGKVAQLVWT